MSCLAVLQKQFIDFVCHDSKEVMEEIAVHRDFAMSIYRNNVRCNLINALRNFYPALLHVLGEREFIELAKQYLEYTISRDGNLDAYGLAMVEFLKNVGQYQQYIIELANLELAYNKVYKARDFVTRAIAVEQYSAVEFEKMSFVVNPSLVLLSLSYDLIDWWSEVRNRDDYSWNGDLFIKRKNKVAIWRNAKNEMRYCEITEQESDFLELVLQNIGFYQIFTKFFSCNQESGLQAVIQKFIINQVIVDIKIEG